MRVLSVLILAVALTLTAVSDTDAAEEKKDAVETLRIGIILYPGFEILDVFGPVEMFYNVGPRLDVIMIAEKVGPVASASVAQPNKPGPKAVADFDFNNAPHLDLILVPGGIGTIREVRNEAMLTFLKERAPKARITSSVCSGSGILAAAGLLDNRRATSNKQLYSLITNSAPNVKWVKEARWVDDGDIITSSGVSAGMACMARKLPKILRTELNTNGIATPTWTPS